MVDLDDPDLHDLLRLAGEDTNAAGLGGRPVLSGGETEWSDYDDDEDDDSDDGKFNYDSDSTAEEEAAARVIDAVADAELDDAEDSRRLDAVLGGVNGSDGDTSPVRKSTLKKAFLQVSSTTVISSQLDEHWEAAIEHLTAQINDLEQSFSFSATVRKALARW